MRGVSSWLAASGHARAFEGVQRLVGTLAVLPALKTGDAVACEALLPDALAYTVRRALDRIDALDAVAMSA